MNKNPALIKLGQNIQKIRKGIAISQERLALLANLDRTYVGGVERGERNVSILNICKLANALNIAPAKLLEGITESMGKLDEKLAR